MIEREHERRAQVSQQPRVEAGAEVLAAAAGLVGPVHAWREGGAGGAEEEEAAG